MATGAFHIDSQEYLGNILGKLHVPGLAGIYASPPFDPIDKTSRIRFGINQLPRHLIIGHISLQCLVEPCGDLFSSASDESRTSVIIAKQIIPEGQPVIRIGCLLYTSPSPRD